MMNLKYVAFGLAVLTVTVFAGVYKWIDEEGNMHYSDSPPERIKSEQIDIIPSPSQPQVEQLNEYEEQDKVSVQSEPQKESSSGQSSTLEALGPLPENTSSKYFETEYAGISLNCKKRTATFSLTLKAKPGLPFGAYLEVQFDNPDDPGTPIVVSKIRQGAEEKITITSREFKRLQCWNYEATINIYRGKLWDQSLGIHKQTIQSRINLEKIKSSEDCINAATGKFCPK